MANTQDRKQVPSWLAAAVVVVALIAIIFYGIHVFRGQAPNSDLKMPTSYPSPQAVRAQSQGTAAGTGAYPPAAAHR